MDGFFGIGFAELFMIAVIALIVLGPERLPGALREVAKVIKQLRKISGELTSQFGDELKALEDLNPRKLLNEMTDPNKPDPTEQAKNNKTTPAAKLATPAKPVTPAKPATQKTTTATTTSTPATASSTATTSSTASTPSSSSSTTTDNNSIAKDNKVVEQIENSIAPPVPTSENTIEPTNGVHPEPAAIVTSVPQIEPSVALLTPEKPSNNGHSEEEKVI